MSTKLTAAVSPVPNRKERRRAKATAVQPAADKPVLGLLHGRSVAQTPRREPDLGAYDDGQDDEENEALSAQLAERDAAYTESEAYVLGGDEAVADEAVDEFFDEHVAELQAGVPVQRPRPETIIAVEDDVEEAPFVLPASATSRVVTEIDEFADASTATPDSVVESVQAVAPPVMADEAAPAAVAVLEPAPASQEAVPPVSRLAGLKRFYGRVARLVKWVDWVAVAIFALIPVLILCAVRFGAVQATVFTLAAVLVAAVLCVAVTQLFAAWMVDRKRYLRALFQWSLTAGVGLLLVVSYGLVWQTLTGSLVFYLFATRKR